MGKSKWFVLVLEGHWVLQRKTRVSLLIEPVRLHPSHWIRLLGAHSRQSIPGCFCHSFQCLVLLFPEISRNLALNWGLRNSDSGCTRIANFPLYPENVSAELIRTTNSGLNFFLTMDVIWSVRDWSICTFAILELNGLEPVVTQLLHPSSSTYPLLMKTVVIQRDRISISKSHFERELQFMFKHIVCNNSFMKCTWVRLHT
jgi:hypothetical protein